MPSPITTVARNEVRLLRADRAALWAVVIFAAATAYALASGLGLRAERAEAARALIAADAERWAEGQADADSTEQVMRAEGRPLDTYAWGPRSPYAVGVFYGRDVAAEPTALSALAVGQADLYPASHQVTARSQMASGTSDALTSPLRLAAGAFDLAFVLLYLLPLLALALGYDLTATDRARGTLRLALAQPITKGTLVAGKLLARGGLLALLVVAATVAGFALAGGGVARWALWTGAALLYGLFWLGLAAAVDARGRSAASNAVVLAVCWLGLGVVFPAAVTLLAGQLHPVPTRAAFVAVTRTAEADASQRGTEPLAQFLADHPEMAEAVGDEASAAESFAVMAIARDAAVAEAVGPVVAQFAERRAQQSAFVRTVGALSPSVLAHAAFLDLAGTGDAQHQRTLDAVAAYQEQWRDHFEPLIFADVPFSAADYDDAPQFAPAPEASGDAMRRAAGPLLGLLLASLVVFGLAAFHRPRTQTP
jgi:ABC-2 type transport system permease protein